MSQAPRPSSALAIPTLASLALALCACTGVMDSPAGPGIPNGGVQPDGGGSAGAPLDPSLPPLGDPAAAGARPLRRLSEAEYNLTLRSLLKDESLAYQDLGGDPQGEHGFAQPGLDVPVQRLFDISETLADGATKKLETLFNCDTAQDSEAVCAERFVRALGRRAYRRSMEDTEVTELVALYTSSRHDLALDYKGGLRMVLTAMLVSPRFLYHWQLGSERAGAGQVVQLKPFELASRLSYFLWSDMPDDELLNAAEQGRLASDADLTIQVERMLRDSRTDRAVQSFHEQWLSLARVTGLSKDPTLYPEWNQDLPRAMLEETRSFVKAVFREPQAPLATLFTAPFSFVNESLAKVYGLSGVTGTELRRVTLDATQRGGLLTQPAVIASLTNPGGTNPARAGKTIYSDILCKKISPPPPGATEKFVHDNALSTRENFAKLEQNDACAACHRVINPIGFAFEEFDAIGRHRTMEGTHSVDASGQLVSSLGTLEFDGLVELGSTLASTPELRECVTLNWLRFALARSESDGDRHSIDLVFKAFHDSGYDLKVLLKQIALSRTFRFRASESGEVM